MVVVVVVLLHLVLPRRSQPNKRRGACRPRRTRAMASRSKRRAALGRKKEGEKKKEKGQDKHHWRCVRVCVRLSLSLSLLIDLFVCLFVCLFVWDKEEERCLPFPLFDTYGELHRIASLPSTSLLFRAQGESSGRRRGCHSRARRRRRIELCSFVRSSIHSFSSFSFFFRKQEEEEEE